MRLPLSWKKDRPFLLLFACIAAARVALLLVSQSAVNGDEAFVGIMATHIIEKGARPVYFYGQDYCGGSVATAYLATSLFAMFGASEFSLKLAIPVGQGWETRAIFSRPRLPPRFLLIAPAW